MHKLFFQSGSRRQQEQEQSTQQLNAHCTSVPDVLLATFVVPPTPQIVQLAQLMHAMQQQAAASEASSTAALTSMAQQLRTVTAQQEQQHQQQQALLEAVGNRCANMS